MHLNSVLCITSSKLKSLHVTLHTCLLLSQDRVRRQETPGGKLSCSSSITLILVRIPTLRTLESYHIDIMKIGWNGNSEHAVYDLYRRVLEALIASSASQKFPFRILCNPHVHTVSGLRSEPDGFSPYLALCRLKIHFNIILPSTPISSEWSDLFLLSNRNLYEFLISSMQATCTAHLTLLHLIVRNYLVTCTH